MVGVFMLWLYDQATQKFEAEYSFNNKERVIVALVWPIALAMFIYALIKTMLDD